MVQSRRMQPVGSLIDIAQNSAQTLRETGQLATQFAVAFRFLPERALRVQIECRQLLADVVMQLAGHSCTLLFLRGQQTRGETLQLRLALPECRLAGL